MMRGIRIDRWIALLLLGILAVLLLAYYQFGIWNDSQVQLAHDKDLLAREWKELDRLQALAQRGDELQAQLLEMEAMIIQEAEVEGLIMQIQYDAGRSGLRLIDITFLERIPGKDYTEMPFKIVLEGSYLSIMQFLDRFNGHSRGLRVDRFSISPGSAELPLLRAEIKASTFYSSGKFSGSDVKRE